MDDFVYNDDLKKEFPSPVNVSLKDLYPDENPDPVYGAGFLNVVGIERGPAVFRDASFTLVPGNQSFVLTPVNVDGIFRVSIGSSESNHDPSSGVVTVSARVPGVYNILYTLTTRETSEQNYTIPALPSFTWLISNGEPGDNFTEVQFTPIQNGGTWTVPSQYGSIVVSGSKGTLSNVPLGVTFTVRHCFGLICFESTVTTPAPPAPTPVLTITVQPGGSIRVSSNYQGIGPNFYLNMKRNGVYVSHHVGGIGGPWTPPIGNPGERWCFNYERIHVGGSNPANLTAAEVCYTYPLPLVPTRVETNNRSAWGNIPDNWFYNSAPRVQSRGDYGTTQVIGGPNTVSVQVYNNSVTPILEFDTLDTVATTYSASVGGSVLSTGAWTDTPGSKSVDLTGIPLGWSNVSVTIQATQRFSNIRSTWKTATTMVTIQPRNAFLQSFGATPTYGASGSVSNLNSFTEFEFDDTGRIGGILLLFGGRVDVQNWVTNTRMLASGNPTSDSSKVHYLLRSDQILRVSPTRVKLAFVRNTGLPGGVFSFLFLRDP